MLRALAAVEQSEIGVREIIAIVIPDISNEIPGKVHKNIKSRLKWHFI